MHRGLKTLPLLLLIKWLLLIPGALTNIQPGNILFVLRNPRKAINEASLGEDTTLRLLQKTYPLRRIDGKPLDAHSPTYVAQAQPVESNVTSHSLLTTSHLVPSDFGAGMSKIPINYNLS